MAVVLSRARAYGDTVWHWLDDYLNEDRDTLIEQSLYNHKVYKWNKKLGIFNMNRDQSNKKY